MAGFIGLARGLGRIGAGLGAARREALDANQRDAERQAEVEREIKQQAFSNWLQTQAMERQARLDDAQRSRWDALDKRQREQDVLGAQESGYVDAMPEAVSAGMNAATMALGMGRGGQAMQPKTAPFRTKVGGVEMQAEDVGGPRYATVGGRLMRMDPQQAANAAARQRAEGAQARYQERMDVVRENAANRRAMAEQSRAYNQPYAGKQLPANKVDELGAYNGLIRSSENALAAFDEARKGGKNITGPITGRAISLFGDFTQMAPSGISARSLLANLSSQVMKDRSGGAITPQEFVRLEPFLPSQNQDETNARQKLVDLQRELRAIREERLSALEMSGFDVSGVRGAAERMPSHGGYSPNNPYRPHGGTR